jgi:hypothetical protein
MQATFAVTEPSLNCSRRTLKTLNLKERYKPLEERYNPNGKKNKKAEKNLTVSSWHPRSISEKPFTAVIDEGEFISDY